LNDDENLDFNPGISPGVSMAPSYDGPPRSGQGGSMTREELSDLLTRQARGSRPQPTIVASYHPPSPTSQRFVNGREVDSRGLMHCSRCQAWKEPVVFKALEPEKGHLSTRSVECNECTRERFAALEANDEWQRAHVVGPYSPEAKAEKKLERQISIGMKKCIGCGVEFLPARKNQTWHNNKCKRHFKYLERKKKSQDGGP